MSLIFVDCEANGPCPGLGVLTEIGAVEYKTRKTFHGILWHASPDAVNPVMSRLDPNAIQKSEAERTKVWQEFHAWLKQFSKGSNDRLIMVSDNPAYDFQWINHGFWHHLGMNPFGHSARRIGDYYAGLAGDFSHSSRWKKLRITKHDHNPVNDAMGNVEAFSRMEKGERAGLRGKK